MSADLTVMRSYRQFGSFASQNQIPVLADVEFGIILSFLGPKNLALAERVSKCWIRCIQSTHQ